MPFWSKKGKERAVIDDTSGEYVGQYGYRLPGDVLIDHQERWWGEMTRRKEIREAIAASMDKADEDWDPCSSISLTTEEAYLEAELMYMKADTTLWTKEEVQQYNPKSFATTAFVRKELNKQFAVRAHYRSWVRKVSVARKLQDVHAQCCKTKAGVDHRLAWAIRNLTTSDGKQLLEDLKIQEPRGSTSIEEAEEAAPPAYTEATSPAYTDDNPRPKDKATKCDEEQ